MDLEVSQTETTLYKQASRLTISDPLSSVHVAGRTLRQIAAWLTELGDAARERKGRQTENRKRRKRIAPKP